MTSFRCNHLRWNGRRTVATTILLWVGAWILVVGLASVGWAGPFCLMGLGCLSLVLVGILGISNGVRLRRWIALMHPAGRTWWGALLAVLLMVMPLCLVSIRFPPGEAVLGNDDQGIYSLSAVSLANTGSYDFPIRAPGSVSAEDLRSLATVPARAEGLRGSHPGVEGDLYYFGFFLANNSTLAPTFPPGYPTLGASFYAIGGWGGLARLNGFLSISSAMVIFLLVSRWFGTPLGYLCYVLLLVNPIQVWGATTAYSEVFLQLIWLLAVWSLVMARAGSVISAVLFGVLAGAAPLIKFEGFLLAVAPPIILLTVSRSWSRPARLGCCFSWAVSSGLTLLVLSTGNYPYVAGTAFAVLRSLPWWSVALCAAISSALVILVRCNPLSSLRGLCLSRVVTALWVAGFILWMLYAYFIRPYTEHPDRFFHWLHQREIESLREQTLIRIGWYLSPIGLLASLGGVLFLLISRKRSDLFLFSFVGSAVLVFLAYDLYIYPSHPYSMRRIIPFTLPLLVVGLVVWPCLFPIPMKIRRMAIAGSGVLFLALHVRGASDLVPEQNRLGLLRQLQHLADAIPERSVVFQSRNDPFNLVGPFLHLTRGITVIQYQAPVADNLRQRWGIMIDSFRHADIKTFHLGLRADVPLVNDAVHLTSITGHLTYREIPYSVVEAPTKVRVVIRPYRLTEFTTNDVPPLKTGAQ